MRTGAAKERKRRPRKKGATKKTNGERLRWGKRGRLGSSGKERNASPNWFSCYYAETLQFYNAHHLLPRKYLIGDPVWVYTPRQRSVKNKRKKDSPCWAGPYRVAAVLDRDNYRVMLDANARKMSRRVHVSLLKEYIWPVDINVLVQRGLICPMADQAGDVGADVSAAEANGQGGKAEAANAAQKEAAPPKCQNKAALPKPKRNALGKRVFDVSTNTANEALSFEEQVQFPPVGRNRRPAPDTGDRLAQPATSARELKELQDLDVDAPAPVVGYDGELRPSNGEWPDDVWPMTFPTYAGDDFDVLLDREDLPALEEMHRPYLLDEPRAAC